MKITLLLFFGLMTISLYGQVRLEPYRLGITVENIDSSSKWYEENLEFELYKKMQFPEFDSLKIYFLRQGNFEIELVEKKTSISIKSIRSDYDLNKAPLQGFTKIAFRVENIQQTFNKIKRNEVKFILEPTYDKVFDVDFFIIEDNDENIIQFIGPKNNE